MARKPKGSHRAYIIMEWASGSGKLLQQNNNKIIHAKINGLAIRIKFVPPVWPHRLASLTCALLFRA